MKVQENVVVTLSEEDVKDLVKKHLKENGFEVVDMKINISHKTETRGYGIMERDQTIIKFENVEANVKRK